MAKAAALLDVSDLSVDFSTRSGHVSAVRGVSFSVRSGEVIGLVGESGCGKSTVARSLIQVLPRGGRVVAGRIMFEGRDVLGLSASALRRVRGPGMAIVFQDPLTAFDPLLTIGAQIAETVRAHEGVGNAAARARAVELLRLVEIPAPDARCRAYPHELSGGMRQRAMIAMAISCNPRLLIADEPTTALDVTIQAQMLELLSRLKSELEMAILIVSHDLGLVAGLADRVLVMYAGQVVEHGTVDDVLLSPVHPYTLGLIESVVRIDGARVARLPVIAGSPPRLSGAVGYCPFGPRCRLHERRCDEANPPLETIRPGHLVACSVVSSRRSAADG
jgi:oligopeptide/dipeptide ABC transporter ATP-binding protein